jgi:hypothetical protein
MAVLLGAGATALRLAWALAVPTIAVGDFAMYRESATHLVEHGYLDGGFIYMPGLVLMLAALQALGGELASAKVLGALFGGLAAVPLYVLTAYVADGAAGAGRAGADGESEPRGVRAGLVAAAGRAPAALVATLLYVVWPGGIALASVIGTDIPAAALLLLALALLVRGAATRPRAAAIAFGAVMGLASYLRAVALPLTVVALGFWLLRGARLRTALARTALSVAVTLLVLAPWAARNARTEGRLSFTDHHGGITALMGSYPNTEGTYARSLNIMFKELTGRTFLSQPHRETDRDAYAIAKRWMRFDPAWTAGMIALRLERLFAAEHGLLYWSVYRPGVLPFGSTAWAWFGRHRALVTNAVDVFYLLFVVSACAGLAFAIAERRFAIMLPAACGVLLAGTYALFVAEPRYRVTTEALFFPVAGSGLQRLAALGLALVRGRGAGAVGRRGAISTAVMVTALVALAFAVVAGGQALRDRHRWAVSLWRVDGVPRLAHWRAVSRLPAGHSPLGGSADAARLRVEAQVDATGGARPALESTVEVTFFDPHPIQLGERIVATLEWSPGADPAASLQIGAAMASGGSSRLEGWAVPPDGGDAGTREGRLPIRLVAPPSATGTAVVVRDVRLDSTGPR